MKFGSKTHQNVHFPDVLLHLRSELVDLLLLREVHSVRVNLIEKSLGS